MVYAPVELPVRKPRFHDMSREEVDIYEAWLHGIATARVAELEQAVRTTQGYEQWDADESPESLDVLATWLGSTITTRSLSASKMDEIRSRLPLHIDVPERALTELSLSFAFDAGIYFARVILRNVPGTQWGRASRAKSMADYGQPVVVGFGKATLNPVRVLHACAHDIAEGKAADLRRLFDVWKSMRA